MDTTYYSPDTASGECLHESAMAFCSEAFSLKLIYSISINLKLLPTEIILLTKLMLKVEIKTIVKLKLVLKISIVEKIKCF